MMQMKTFYGVAGILISLSVIFSTWQLISGWGVMILPAKLAFIFGTILFQTLMAALFIGLWKITPDMVLKDDKELESFLNDSLKGGIDNNGKKTD